MREQVGLKCGVHSLGSLLSLCFTLITADVIWLYFAGLGMIIQGLQLQQYMQFHPGLRIYATLLGRSFVFFKDFLLYFAYLVLGLMFGVGYLMIASGGNPDFMTNAGAFSGILRLTFGYYDYADFIANYQGIGAFGFNSDLWYVEAQGHITINTCVFCGCVQFC